MKMQLKKVFMVLLLTAGLTAGCGTNTAGSGQAAKTTSDVSATADGTGASVDTAADGASVFDADTATGGTDTSDSDSQEKTEVRREKYDDCDGSGHGYVEIYYSDGSMETEEY